MKVELFLLIPLSKQAIQQGESNKLQTKNTHKGANKKFFSPKRRGEIRKRYR